MGCHAHLALQQEGTNHRRTDTDASYIQGLAGQYVHTHLLAKLHVVVKTFLTLMPKAVVISYHQSLHP